VRVPNGGHGDLFQTRERGGGWEVVFHDVYPRAEAPERVLTEGLDQVAAYDFMWGAIHGFDDPNGSEEAADHYGAGVAAGRALRSELLDSQERQTPRRVP
jgi:hypothetical protein